MHNHNSFPGLPSWSGTDPVPSHHRALAPYDLPQFWTPDLFYPRRDGAGGCLVVLVFIFALVRLGLQAAGCLGAPDPTKAAPHPQSEVVDLPFRGPWESASYIHVVVAGETLSGIARECMGDVQRWRELLPLNPEITDPNRLVVGQRIQCPNR